MSNFDILINVNNALDIVYDSKIFYKMDDGFHIKVSRDCNFYSTSSLPIIIELRKGNINYKLLNSFYKPGNLTKTMHQLKEGDILNFYIKSIDINNKVYNTTITMSWIYYID
jgi:hypothetical protein